MYTQKEFIEKSRKKFSEFQNMDDSQVLKTMLEKFPIYKSQISDYKEKNFFEKTLDYGKEVGGKVLEGVDNAFTDAADLTIGNVVRGFGGEYEAKPIRHNLGIKDESDYDGGLLKNIGRTWEKSGGLIAESIDDMIENPSLKNIGQETFNFSGNLIGGVANTFGDVITSGLDTVVSDETQNDLKKYLAEKSQEDSFVGGTLRNFAKLQQEYEKLRETDPEQYRQLSASFGFLEILPITKGGKIIGNADEIVKKYGKKGMEVIKNKVDDGLKMLDNLKGKTDETLENIGKNLDEFGNIKPKESFFTKIEEKIAGIDDQTKNILKNSSDEDFENYLNYAKNAVDDIKNPTPLEVAGDEAGDVLKILGDLKNNAGASKSQALKMVENLKIDTKPIFDDFVDFLGKSNLTIDGEGKIKNISGKIANIGTDSIREIQELSDEMLEIFTRDKIDLGSLDALVDRVQDGINFKALNRPGALPSKTEKQISGFLGKSLNGRLKEVAGEDFVKYNDEFRKYLKLENKLSKLLGEDGNKGGSLMKAVFSPTDRGVKKLFSEIQEVTGVDLISKAGLAKFAMQAVGDGRQASLLEAIDLGAGFTGKLKNKLSNIPVVGNFVDLAEDGARKVFSPEKVGRKIVGKKTGAKHYVNVDSSVYKNISNIEAEKIVKKYFGDEVGVEFLEKIKTPEGLEALGRYKDNLIEFAKNPKENVVHHESLHAYFDLAVKPKKQREILDLIKKNKNFKTDLDAEEFLADSFADFVIGRKNISGISGKISQFLEDLSFKFKKFFGKEDKVEALFRDLEDIGKGKKNFEKVNLGNKNDEKYLLAGENAKRVSKTKIALAEEMEKSGKNADEIWEKTGFERGKDGKWRFEIDDSEIKILKNEIGEHKLEEILEHEKLFENYPEIKDLKVEILDDLSSYGYFSSDENKIYLKNDKNFKNTLVHEIQHYIQEKEGFISGTNKNSKEVSKKIFEKYSKEDLEKIEYLRKKEDVIIKMLNDSEENKLNGMFLAGFDKLSDYMSYLYDDLGKIRKELDYFNSKEIKISENDKFYFYNSKSGEVEARNIEKRLELSKTEKKNIRPEKTEDISRDRQWNGKESEKNFKSNENKIIKIGKNEYGPIWEGVKGAEAEDFMIKKQKGEIKNAFHYKNDEKGIDINIDLLWGGYNSEKGKGLGYSKILEKHPEVIGRIQDLLDNLPYSPNSTNNKIVLGNEYSVVVIKLELDGKSKNWIMTAYDRN